MTKNYFSLKKWHNIFLSFKLLKYAILLFYIAISSITYGQYTYLTNTFTNAGFPGAGFITSTSGPSTGSGWTQSLAGSLATNQWSSVMPIPFAFDFYGVPVTGCVASGNGLLTFTTTVSGTPLNANTGLPNAALPDNTIAALWDEFTNTPPTGSNDVVLYTTFGTAPNREFWVYWYSFEYGNPNASFQYNGVMLQEGTNKVFVVDAYGTTPALTATVGLQKNATIGLDLGSSIAQGPNTSAVTMVDYYEFTPLLLINDNAGITSLLNPTNPLVAGTQAVQVSLKNWGQNTLDSTIINWSLNGVLQTPYTYYGPLSSLQSAPVTIGTGTFVAGNNEIIAWTSLPNGLTDADSSNDTLTSTLCTGLVGTYTIGGATPDYATFLEAANDLNSCGIGGPVTFNVASGTYNEFFELGQIVGSSAVNTVTFNGGSTSTTSLIYNGAGNRNAVITFNGTDYVTFKNLTIQNTESTADGWGILLTNQADYISIDSCIITVANNLTASSFMPVVSTGSLTSNSTTGNNANYFSLTNSTLNGGYYGVRFYGQSSAVLNNIGNIVDNCIFNDIYYYGVYAIYQDGLKIKNSFINFRSGISTSYGININTSKHSLVEGNTILNNYTYGIYFSGENQVAALPTMRSSIVNNMVSAKSSGDGIYLTSSDDMDVFNNSILAEGDQAIWLSTTSNNYNIRNNIFVSNVEPVDIDLVPGATDVIDYNIYHRTTTGIIAAIGTPTYASLALWQAADATRNINSLQGDPSFVSPTNLHAQGALANNTAVFIPTVTLDIDEEIRSTSTPDIGADEYSPATCITPSALTSFMTNYTTGTLSWTPNSASAWVLEWGIVGFTQGTGTTVSLTDTFTTISTFTPNTFYSYYVREYCGGTDSSLWAGPYTFYSGYCVPSSSSALTYINNFSTSGGNVNISNLLSGYTAGGYQDNYATHYVEVGAGTSFTYNYDYIGGSLGTAIWIDWNNNLIFEASERVFNTTTYQTLPFSGSIPVALGQALGDYRMRVMVDYNAANPSDPCMTANTRVEVEDYKITVVAQPTCFVPSALTANVITEDSAYLQWTSNTASAWVLEYGVDGFVHGTGTVLSLVDTFAGLSGLMPSTNYDYYVREYCAVGDSSAWAGPISFYTGHCLPASSTADTYIAGFTTSSGNVNISNLASGFTAGGYQNNYATHFVEVGAGTSFDYNFTVVGGSLGAAIWIDWNNNLIFEASERVFNTTSYGFGPYSGSIPVSVAQTLGDYRMRVMVDYNVSNPTNPCMSGQELK